jgi:hypothetical protein
MKSFGFASHAIKNVGHIRIRIRKSESTAIIIRNSYPQIWILADVIAALHSYYPQYPQYPHCDGVTCDLA